MPKRTIKTCSIEDCRNEVHGRGWCKTHYGQWRHHGDPRKRMRFPTAEEAFEARTEWRGNCLVWTGSKIKGYGELRVKGKSKLAHRYAWEQENGPIPEGMFIDHKLHCDVSCCNVEHLRLATLPQNNAHKSGAQVNNKSSGARNVYPSGKRWMVRIQKHGKYNYFGSYETIEEAKKVAEKARKDLFGDFAGRG